MFVTIVSHRVYFRAAFSFSRSFPAQNRVSVKRGSDNDLRQAFDRLLIEFGSPRPAGICTRATMYENKFGIKRAGGKHPLDQDNLFPIDGSKRSNDSKPWMMLTLVPNLL